MSVVNTSPISGNLNKYIPQILLDIVEYLKEYTINISEDIEGEGRGGSLKDEGTVKIFFYKVNLKIIYLMKKLENLVI